MPLLTLILCFNLFLPLCLTESELSFTCLLSFSTLICFFCYALKLVSALHLPFFSILTVICLPLPLLFLLECEIFYLLALFVLTILFPCTADNILYIKIICNQCIVVIV